MRGGRSCRASCARSLCRALCCSCSRRDSAARILPSPMRLIRRWPFSNLAGQASAIPISARSLAWLLRVLASSFDCARTSIGAALDNFESDSVAWAAGCNCRGQLSFLARRSAVYGAVGSDVYPRHDAHYQLDRLGDADLQSGHRGEPVCTVHGYPQSFARDHGRQFWLAGGRSRLRRCIFSGGRNDCDCSGLCMVRACGGYQPIASGSAMTCHTSNPWSFLRFPAGNKAA